MNDLKQLEHFLAVCELGSFRAVADASGLSQSTITKSIRRLERDVGVRLFNRTTRSVHPTVDGLALRSLAQRTVDAAGQFQHEAQLRAGGNVGTLRIGAIAVAADLLVAPALARLSQSHPQLEVEVVVGSADVYRDLATGECDVVIGDEANFRSSAHARTLRMLPIRVEPLVAVHRRTHPGKRANWEQLLTYPWAVPSRYFADNQLFTQLAEFVPKAVSFPRYRLTSLSSCLALAAASDVITLAPKGVVQREPSMPELTWRQLGVDVSLRLALFTVAHNPLSSGVNALRESLRL